MASAGQFDEALEVVGRLSIDEQTALLSVLQHRLAEQGRDRVVRETRQADEEYSTGACRPASPQQLMDEL